MKLKKKWFWVVGAEVLVSAGLLFSMSMAVAQQTSLERPFWLDLNVSAAPAPTVNQVAAIPLTPSRVAVGQRGTIWLSNNSGRSWSHVDKPARANADLWAITVGDSLNLTAVGDGGTILRSESGGMKWEAVGPNSQGDRSDLRAVAIDKDGVGLAVGREGAIVRTETGGRTWTAVGPSKTKSTLNAVATNGAAEWVAVGDNETILYSSDGGKTWTPADIAPFEPNYLKWLGQSNRPPLHTVKFLDATTAIVASLGSDLLWEDRAVTVLLRTQDGGKHWTHPSVPLDLAVQISSLAFATPSIGVAVGKGAHLWALPNGEITNAREIGAAVLLTRDGGLSWKTASVPGNIDSLIAASLTDANEGVNGLAVASSGEILESQGAGTSWQIRQPGNSQAKPVAAMIAKAVLADGVDGIAVDSKGHLMRSDLRGPWVFSSAPPGIEPNLTAVAYSGDHSAVAIGDQGAVVITKDDGNSWQPGIVPYGVQERLESLAFGDARVGVILGSEGSVLGTDDGGQTWNERLPRADNQNKFRVVQFANADMVTAAGDSIVLSSRDGGRTWERNAPPTELNIRDLQFNGGFNGVAVGGPTGKSGKKGTTAALWSDDAGRRWHTASMPEDIDDLWRVAFSNARVVLAVGHSALLRSEDAGHTWTKVDLEGLMPSGGDYMEELAFDGRGAGLIQITSGDILYTENDGVSWSPAKLPPNPGGKFSILGTSLLLRTLLGTSGKGDHIAFVGAATAIAIHPEGKILMSRDGGKTWGQHPEFPELRRVHACCIAHGISPGSVIIVGDDGVRLTATAVKYAPYVTNSGTSVRQGLAGSVEIALQLALGAGNSAHVSNIEYRLVTKDATSDWNKIKAIPHASVFDGLWRTTWSPGDEGIRDGTTLEHRVWLDDGGTALRPILLNTIVFRPFFSRIQEDYPKSVWTTVGVLFVIIVYLIPVLTMFLLMPARLAIGSSAGVLDAAIEPAAETGGGLGSAAVKILKQVTLPWFKRRPRVRRAWLAKYRRDSTMKFLKLAPDVRADFLEHTEVLDSWVERRLPIVRESLAQLPLYSARKIYIPFPVRIGDIENNLMIEEVEPEVFLAALGSDRTIIAIVGEGGCGKTTLACALARWALWDESGRKLLPHPMIPVVVAEDTTDLLGTVNSGLKKMVGAGEELELDIVQSLLRKKRILVIVDALSERSPETQKHIHDLYGENTPINAMVVTSRRKLDVGAVRMMTVYPQPIGLRLLVPFILDYLKRRELAQRFSPQQQLALAQRILQIVEVGDGVDVTPLLTTLFVESVGARKPTSNLNELPINVPEVYMDYLRRLNPTEPETPSRVEHGHLQEGSMIVAQASLAGNFIPTDFARKEALARLEAVGFTSAATLIERLILNGVLRERSVAALSILRFQLDPVAEYLAAIRFCHELGSKQDAWKAFIEDLVSIPTYPEGIRGFLTALSVTYDTYREMLKLPPLNMPWRIV